jgi:hypothetical protein
MFMFTIILRRVAVAAFFLLSVFQVSAQNVRAILRVTAPGSGGFSEQIEAIDVNGDGFKEFFVGAPLSTYQGAGNSGFIYMMDGRVRELSNPNQFRDSTLTSSSVILAGNRAQSYFGRRFVVGLFNGDTHHDFAVTRFGTATEPGSVAIFFGPFQSGTARQLPDVVIQSEQLFDGFGISLAVATRLDGLNRDGLAIGANGKGSDEQGQVLLFRGLDGSVPLLQSSAATTVFNGPEEASLFGSSMQWVPDINGDGINDLVISAPTSSEVSGGFKRGSIYIFNGPFRSGQINTGEAMSVIHGRQDNNSWGSRVFHFGDINKDGISDIGFSSIIESAVAMAVGRRTWSSSITIGTHTGRTDTLVYYRTFSGQQATGSGAVFNGDYNKDGIFDPVIGSRGNEVTASQGAFAYWLLSGAPRSQPVFVQPGFGTSLVSPGNFSPNDPYAVDDLVVTSPLELAGQGYLYFFRGELNPPTLTFDISPSTLLEIGQAANLNISWTQGSRQIREARLVRAYQKKTDTTRFTLGGSNSISIQQRFEFDVNVSFVAEVLDDLGVLVRIPRSVFFGAYPKNFTLASTFSSPVVLEGDRNKTLPLSWTASVDTNKRNLIYQIWMASTPGALALSAPGTGRTFMGQFINTTSGSASFGDIRALLAMSGAQIGQTARLHWTVYAFNGVLYTEATNGPLPVDFTLKPLDNNLLLTTASRGVTILGLKEDGVTFGWNALQSDQVDLLVRYEFMVLRTASNTGEVLFSSFTSGNGAGREFRLSYEQIDKMLTQANLKTQATTDSARVFFTARALINESSYWYANNGPRKLGIKFVRIFNDTADERPNVPAALSLKPAFPNPFNPSVTVPFGIPVASPVSIDVFNMLGQRVHNWKSGTPLNAGWHHHQINGAGWASGIYFVRVQSGSQVQTSKITLVK